MYEKKYLITEQMLHAFGAATGDFNPIHFDENFAKRTRFEGCVVHGMLIGGLISASMTDCYGIGTIYLSQDLKFLAPVRVGDEVTIKFTDYKEGNKATTVNTQVFVDDTQVISGEGKVLVGNKNE